MQKQKWEEEYQKLNNLPSSRTDYPSKAVRWFMETYGEQVAFPAHALDLGAGKGRNCFYLAEQGFTVTGIEMSEVAVDVAGQENRNRETENGISFVNQSVGEPWLVADSSVDLVIDMMCLHLLDAGERKVYVQEVNRVLKPGGFYLLHTIAAESEEAQRLFVEHPGPEINSYIIPDSGMVEKAFTRTELESMFEPLNLESIEEKITDTQAFGGLYKRRYYVGVWGKSKI